VEDAGYLAVTLAWPDAAIEEDGYTLERSTDGQKWLAIAELNADTQRYVDYGLALHTQCWYRLTVYNRWLAGQASTRSKFLYRSSVATSH